MFVLGRRQQQMTQEGFKIFSKLTWASKTCGYADRTVVLCAEGSVCVLQMLSMSHSALQSTLIVCSQSSSFQDKVIPCQDFLSHQVCWHRRGSKPQSKTMLSRSPHEGPELNDAVRLSVALYHVLLFPDSRPRVPFGRLGVNSKHCVPSHTGCTAVPKHKSVFSAIVQTESPHGQLSHN